MMQLVIVVLAIGLTAILVAGGVNYLSTDLGLKIEVSQALRVQHDAIVHAASSYKTANNGHEPDELAVLSGYLPNGKIPDFPRGGAQFVWEFEGNDLCLVKQTSEPIPPGIATGVVAFAVLLEKSNSGTVRYGLSCDASGKSVNDPLVPLSIEFLNTQDAVISLGGH